MVKPSQEGLGGLSSPNPDLFVSHSISANGSYIRMGVIIIPGLLQSIFTEFL